VIEAWLCHIFLGRRVQLLAVVVISDTIFHTNGIYCFFPFIRTIIRKRLRMAVWTRLIAGGHS
jgi:hypothetical protein